MVSTHSLHPLRKYLGIDLKPVRFTEPSTTVLDATAEDFLKCVFVRRYCAQNQMDFHSNSRLGILQMTAFCFPSLIQICIW